MHVGQAEFAASVAIRELFMVIADQFHDRGMQIVDMDLVFNGTETEFVRCAVDIAAANSTAGHPHREAPVIVVASVDLPVVAALLGKFDNRRAAKFATPDHERFFDFAEARNIWRAVSVPKYFLARSTPSASAVPFGVGRYFCLPECFTDRLRCQTWWLPLAALHRMNT